MQFSDEVIEELDLRNVHHVMQLIVEYLCGERYLCQEEHFKKLIESDEFKKDRELLTALLENAEKNGLNYEQFNELLLLLNQDRVSKAFFNKFFFGKETICLEDLRKGVTEFRGFAMLCFGNFRFAYQDIVQRNEKGLKAIHKLYCRESDDILKDFERPRKTLRIDPIVRNKTWYLGNISKEKFDKEYKTVEDSISAVEECKEGPLIASREELVELSEQYLVMHDETLGAQEKALKNTSIYLTWDYMDVYIATSMRHKWEFEGAFDFIKAVFSNSKIKKLHLRYFDPTQSKCRNRIDKGLTEGLMLKRVRCCIYMGQESDTMGKDSELAATLAQGKPVIAYIPAIRVDEYCEKVKEYPLDYFEKRLLILQAEGTFDDEKCSDALKNYDREFLEKVENFLRELNEYRSSQPLTLWDRRENEFRRKSDVFPSICQILAIAEYHNFERRAEILTKYHPLAVQVDLKSGVANGVLVVRHAEECAKLLYQILTNSMEFTIKHVGEKGKGFTELEEKVSGCPFRVVTDDEKLTNSFWNFYLTSG